MRLFELFGRRGVKSDAPVRETRRPAMARVVANPIAATTASMAVAAPSTAQDLRRRIFAAVASNDSQRLASMFRDDPEGIVGQATDWMKVPEELQPNPAAVTWYRDGLQAVAQYCADRLDRPDLVQRLEEVGISIPVAAEE